jgi:hypothetical protein
MWPFNSKQNKSLKEFSSSGSEPTAEKRVITVSVTKMADYVGFRE